ncbi:putative WRKY transcription factor 41 [Canna indica]|uniref:WRKY transcription factor 41 n=1 Tax=Canna indica TaxID=4628 RepID=A0AAQ3L4L6_9LILI|nr:putative WRKY transcription factor 41 [Canna indica]
MEDMNSMQSNQQSMLLLSELVQVKELVMQLATHLHHQQPPLEFCKYLAPKILSSVDRLICRASSSNSEGKQQLPFQNTVIFGEDSPQYYFTNGSLFAAAKPSSTLDYNCTNILPKKRKTLPERKVQMRVSSSGGGSASSLDDGFYWRKYGNKTILGAKHPRSYYRCKDRTSKGCLATKQVQQSNKDPQVLDITYHGIHTCRASSCLQAPKPVCPLEPKIKQENKPNQQQVQDLVLEFHTAETEVMGKEETMNNLSVAGSSSASRATSESACLFDELYHPTESKISGATMTPNSFNDFILMDLWSMDYFDTQLADFQFTSPA